MKRFFTRQFLALNMTLGLICALSALAHAASDDVLTAEVDRTTISEDETVTLKLVVHAEPSSMGGMFRAPEPTFRAPDFEVVNEFQNTFVESVYENGRFSMKQSLTLNKVLKPSKQGVLRITDIEVKANGKTYRAPVISVEVTASGSGSGGGNYGGGTTSGRANTATAPKGNPQFFLKAEANKTKAYKGEQVIVSYSLYRRTRVFNIQVDKYPVLNGFLREDLDMPVLGQRLPTDGVIIHGTPYERSLLVRYAAYPLHEGKATIDTMAIRAQYLNRGRGNDDNDPFMGFLNQFNTLTGTMQSEPLQIEVLPLPETGKPQDFTGAVGKFEITGAVDKTEVELGNPITLTVKVEGRGNLAPAEKLSVQWPANVNLFDSNGRSKTTGGVAERIYEFVIIPREAGKLELPAIPFSYFDPNSGNYQTIRTASTTIQVKPGAGGITSLPAANSSHSTTDSSATSSTDSSTTRAKAPTLRPLKSPEGEGRDWGFLKLAWKWTFGVAAACILLFLALILKDAWKRRTTRGPSASQIRSKTWKEIDGIAQNNSASWNQILEAYSLLEDQIYQSIDQKYPIASRSYARSDLGTLLTEEHQLKVDTWKMAAQILEAAESARYATQFGAMSQSEAKIQLQKWVALAKRFDDTLTRA